MGWLIVVLYVLVVVSALLLIGLILIQPSKGGGMGAAFGGVGETLEEREGGSTEAVLARQIREGLAGLDAAALSTLIIAYEPVWAIGTGRTATPEMAEETQRAIRGFVAEQFGAAAAADLTIQYGGSMKPANAGALCAQADINGGLIGGAALKADSFAELVKNAIAGNGEK